MADNLGITTEVKKEYSAGGIVYQKQDDQLLILLIRTSGATPEERDNVWGFPKGHLEDGEDARTAALREVREEAGVEARITKDLEPTEYSFFGLGI
jgi:ADP-ribose pyrophosphatase YjhB (NUDIX family)